MDSNNWRPQQSDQPPLVDGGDWRTQLQHESRQRIVNKIMETLKRHLPLSGPEGLQELKKIAVRFEEKIYSAATSQSDYLRKISLKMLTMESKSQNTLSLPATSGGAGGVSRNSQDPVLAQNVQSQVHNQGQSVSLPMVPNQPQARQLLAQNIQNNLASPGMQASAGLPNPMSNVTQNQNLQNVSGMSQNSMGGTITQSVASNMLTNAQRQMQGKQHMQQISSQQQPLQSQTPQQYMYSQQLQNQMMKQKLQSGNIQQSLGQTPVLQQQQMQTSQQPVMQTSSGVQPAMISGLQQNQQSIQQPSQSVLPHEQSVLRQQQQKQPSQQNSVVQQPQTQISQQQMMPSQQQQQQLMGQQTNSVNMQQNQMIGQQSNISDMQQQQQQRLLGQQNGLPNLSSQQKNNHQNLQQHLMGQQGNISNIQQQLSHQTINGLQQQVQPGNSSMQTNQHSIHMLQQPNIEMQQQIQSAASLLPSSGQQTQPQSQSQSQQQSMSQLQTQSPHVQPLGLPQQPSSLQHNMQQRIQNSIPLLQHQASLDSTAQTGGAIANTGDWKEEVYQRIKFLKDSYLAELSEMHQKISMRLQQNESLPQQPKAEQLEKIRIFKNMLEKLIAFIQVQKGNLTPGHRDKLPSFEKQIISVLNSQNRPRRPGPSMHQAQMQAQPQAQQSQSQFSQGQSLDSGANPQLPSMNMKGSVASMHQSNVSNLQPSSNMDSGQGTAPNSVQQVAMGPLQQNPASALQQGNMSSLQSQGGVNLLQQNVNPQSNSMLQNQHLKQQQDQILQAQQFKQLQSRQLQQHMLQKQLQQQQQQLQQPQFHQQTKQQQATQMQPQQMSQSNQMNDVNELKMRQGLGGRSGGFPQHLSSTQRHQLLQAGSQINQHSSPHIDQQNMLPSGSKTGAPLQSANSLFVPSPSTPVAPSPMPGEFEKPSVSSLSNTANIGHLQINGPPAADGTHGNASTTVSGKSIVTEQPVERLIKAVKSISSKALNSSVSDIESVVSMIDCIAGSAPGNGSRATVGEDLVAMTKCRLQTRNFLTQDGNVGTKRMRQYTSVMPLNVASSVGNTNDSLKQFIGSEMPELESIPSIKKAKIEINHDLMKEIKEINERLIDTVVDISDEEVDPSVAVAAAMGSEGTVIKCSFSAVSLSPNLKSQYTSAQMSPIQPLRLLVPMNYPNCSPILLDKSIEVSKECEDLSVKAKSRFNICLRSLSQPMSLREIARTWDNCARAIISEYAQQKGGGTFSSKFGAWENCLSAA